MDWKNESFTKNQDNFSRLLSGDIGQLESMLDQKQTNLLYLSPNSKVRHGLLESGLIQSKKEAWAFGLPSMYTCPGMGECARDCYAFALSNIFSNVSAKQWHNIALIYITYYKGGIEDVISLIIRSIKAKKSTKVVRIHDFGDFFSAWYFMAWHEVAIRMPDVRFYAYTKSFHILDNSGLIPGAMPTNFILNLSSGTTPSGIKWAGDKFDKNYQNCVSKGFRTCFVVFEMSEYPELPFNNEEVQASLEYSDSNSSNFKIGIHSQSYHSNHKAFKAYTAQSGVDYC